MSMPQTVTTLAPRQRASQDARRARAAIGWGAAIVDEQGNETPITESMIERACEEMASYWLFPRRGSLAG